MLIIKAPTGIMPLFEATELPDNAAQVAQNCRFNRGDVRGWPGTADVATLTKPGPIRSIYRFGQDVVGDATFWFHWDKDVDVVRGQVASDTTERTYFTGDGLPKVTNAALALTGGTTYPVASYTLGVPAPTTAPVATEGSGGTTTTVEQSRAYLITFVTDWGEEGAPSLPSNIVSVYEGQAVELSSLEGPPAGAFNITKKRIYRNAANGAYFFVAEIPVAQTTFTDSISDTGLGETLGALENEMPPADLFGLVAYPNGGMVGFSGSDICPCLPYKPYAWPSSLRDSVPHKIIGGAVIGQTLVVLTDGFPYAYNGTDTTSLSGQPIESFPHACVARRSIAKTEAGVIYAAPRGLAAISQNGSRLLTEGILTQEAWDALKPASIHAYGWDGKYIAFYDNGTTQGGFILDPQDARAPLTMIDMYATAGYTDLRSGRLYLVVGNTVKCWAASGAALLPYTWRSKRFVLLAPSNFSVAQVKAVAYPVTFRLIGDGATVITKTVTDDKPFRLPAGTRYDEVELEMTGVNPVKGIFVANSVKELQGV
jgi:hypothetical protein